MKLHLRCRTSANEAVNNWRQKIRCEVERRKTKKMNKNKNKTKKIWISIKSHFGICMWNIHIVVAFPSLKLMNSVESTKEKKQLKQLNANRLVCWQKLFSLFFRGFFSSLFFYCRLFVVVVVVVGFFNRHMHLISLVSNWHPSFRAILSLTMVIFVLDFSIRCCCFFLLKRKFH